MLGRIENDNKRNENVSRIISAYPGYMKDYVKRFESRTAATKEKYVRNIIDFLRYVENDGRYNIKTLEELSKIKTSFINGYLYSINSLSPVTRANRLASIKDFFDFMCEDEYIENNPCNKVKPPKIEENINVVSMTPEEIAHVKDRVYNGNENETSREKARRENWRSRDLAVITLGCQTGLRVSSITEINIEDINFAEKKIVVVVKGNKTRECAISDKTIEAIKRWMVDREKLLNGSKCSALFISNRKSRISVDTVSRIVERGASDLNKHITPHKMRSSCATNLYNATGDIYLVQTVLGHSNIKNTRRYAKVEDEKLNNAASILDNMY